MAGGTEYTPEILTEAENYFKTSWETGTFISVAELALRLNIARSTVYKWAEEKPEFSDIVEKILAWQEINLTKNGLSGDYNASIAKLLLSKHGYADKVETDVTTKGAAISMNPANAAIASKFEEELKKNT